MNAGRPMPAPRSRDYVLLAAGALSAGMGLYHFFLPAQFGWADLLAHDRMLRWALLSINTFFSYLLLAGGVLTLAVAWRPRPRDRSAYDVVVAMTGFWTLNAAYQWLSPMPLPPRLGILHVVLLGFALITLALHAWALHPSRR